jgi:Na+-transporting NADH:ubiquinone oxidoreductase subunit A
MSTTVKIKKGKNIPLVGVAESRVDSLGQSPTYAIKPPDFKGVTPKLAVKQGDEVKAGSPLFYDKSNPDIKFVSPVSGEVAEVVRGARRAILEVRVLADSTSEFVKHDTNGWDGLERTDFVKLLMHSGWWPSLVQRPFGVIADPETTPKAIFISGFDSSPLAPDPAVIMEGKEEAFKSGISALRKLTDGMVHLGVRKGQTVAAYQGTSATVTEFEGPHPAGLAGVQIHHVSPINKGETVWTVRPEQVAWLGSLLDSGVFAQEKTVALAGQSVKEPHYYRLTNGASIKSLVEGQLKEENVRIISGDVLTGDHVSEDGYVGFNHNLISVIPEGDEREFLGWLIPSYPRPTASNSLPISKFFTKRFKVNTNYHGEERAFVVTGQYDKVLPMDILPVPLLKSILAQNLEEMENLGIYEVIEEDMALCEFVCTSKIEVQKILRDGLDLIAEEV